MDKSNTYSNYSFLDKKIEMFCQSLEALLNEIHDRCGTLDKLDDSFLDSKIFPKGFFRDYNLKKRRGKKCTNTTHKRKKTLKNCKRG